MFVVGTAGHIDHGKSSLIKAMTGIDPDRLPEEKKRGMTIDLGFAWMNLPSGEEIGLVDVPGHERFVRNMVAGAGGINAAILVIAADDGWMPQTQEHLDILNLLDINHGFVALTKIDLADEDWIELVKTDIEAKLAGTFLEGCPIIPCSSETKEGVPDVIASIEVISQQLQEAEDIGKTRLFIDRSFLLTGIGVVVTGTSRGGGFSADTDAFHFPSGDRVRIRSLQSHERKVEQVGSGTRVAINITGADREEITRGDVITSFPYVDNPEFFAVTIKNLTNSSIVIKEGRKVLIIHGTTETDAIIRPFEDKGIKPGEEGLAIIKTVKPLAAFVMDTFILRLPTPQITIGGGKILDVMEEYPKRKSLNELEESLIARKTGELKKICLVELEKRLFTARKGFLAFTNFSFEKIESVIESLISENIAKEYESLLTILAISNEIGSKIKKTLEKTHRNKSYLKGLTVEELAKRVKQSSNEQFLILLKYLEYTKTISRSNQYYHLSGFAPSLDETMNAESQKIMTEIKNAGHSYLTFEDIERKFKNCRSTLNFLRDDGQLKTVGTQFIMAKATWNEILGFLEKRFADSGRTSLAEFRDSLQTTRKYALPLLEFLDQLKITKREGDYRVPGVDFNERHIL